MCFSVHRGYIYGAVNGHSNAMFMAAAQSLILTLKLTLTLILT